MTKDDKCLRETVQAELRRRRGLLGRTEDTPRTAHGNDRGGAAATARHERQEPRIGPRPL
jgi:hypothetical protein